MTAVGCWLLVIGLCDLVRAARDATAWSRRLLLVALGACLLLGAGLGLDAPAWLVVGWVVTSAVWVLGSAAALVGHRPGARAIALVGAATGVGLSLLAGDAVSTPDRVLSGPLGGVPPETLLIGAGVLVVQLASANVLVRLILDAVGVPASDNEKSLKGGRLLGPMERLMIVGLGLAGELTAAALVVAAKGLLRFPELQRGARTGPSDLMEYFLIGSFASWLVALGGVALTHL